MSYISAIKTPDNVQHDFKAVAIPYGEVDSTSTSTAFTATVPGITSLDDGVCIYLKNGIITSASGCTLNVNNLGAKPIYSSMSQDSEIGSLFNINYTYLLVYSTNKVTGGCWDAYLGYDSNTHTSAYQIRVMNIQRPTTDSTGKYRVYFSNLDNTEWIPATTSTSSNATASRTPNTRVINPFGKIIAYAENKAISQGDILSKDYSFYQVSTTIGYSFNNTGAALNLTYPAPFYIKCTPQNSGGVIMNDYTQTLPSTQDGYVYLYLGEAVAAGVVQLSLQHPIFYYSNGEIRIWTNDQVTKSYVDIGLSGKENLITRQSLTSSPALVTPSGNQIYETASGVGLATLVLGSPLTTQYITLIKFYVDSNGCSVTVPSGYRLPKGISYTTSGTDKIVSLASGFLYEMSIMDGNILLESWSTT